MLSSGSSFAKRLAHALHVFVAADLVVLLQAHLDESGVRGRVAACRWTRSPGVDADVGHDHPEISSARRLRGSRLRPAGRHCSVSFEPRARGGLQVDDELAGVGPRERRRRRAGGRARSSARKTPSNADDRRCGPGERRRASARRSRRASSKQRLNQCDEPAERRASVGRGPPRACALRGTAAQNSGTTVMATKYEANSESTTASASAVKRNRLTP